MKFTETYVHLTEVLIVAQGLDEEGKPLLDENGSPLLSFEDHIIRVRMDQIIEYCPTTGDISPAKTHIKTPYRDIFVKDSTENIDHFIAKEMS